MSESHAELLSRLIAFDTTSHLSNLPIIEFIEGYLVGYGIESELVKSPDGKKANLFATIGPKDVAGIALSGHTDVVPVGGSKLDVRPLPNGPKTWPALRAGHLRHEGVRGLRTGSGSQFRLPGPGDPDPPGILL